MIIKLNKDQIIKHSPMCGEIREVLLDSEYSPSIAIAVNILPTKAHYHKGFDEVYFVLDGYIHLKLYDPGTNKIMEQILNSNELCVITKGIHHGIIESSKQNRLCVITVPNFIEGDETPSDMI
jgi:mannose-6-phosphate isomerase-like protein (cupin superfamily)